MRKDRRAPSNFEVEYRFENADGSQSCQAIDISQSGIFLNLEPVPALETRLYLMFTLPGFTKLGPLKVIGRVVRIVPQGEGQAPGVGVSFDIIYADNRDAIKAFIRNVLGPTLVARTPMDEPVARKQGGKPGARYKLKFDGDAPPVQEHEADSDEDRLQLKRFKGFSAAGGASEVLSPWLKYGLFGAAALFAAAVIWFAVR